MTYGQFCPVSKAAEIFATRWTPLILRELMMGSTRFNDIHRGLPLMSRTLLAQRLRELERAGVVRAERRARGHDWLLTEAGEAFRPMVEALHLWGRRWGRSLPTQDDMDPTLLMWDIHRKVLLERVTPGRHVLRFHFRGVPRQFAAVRRVWLVLTPNDADVCHQDPGYPVTLAVEVDVGLMCRIWMGYEAWEEALRRGAIQFDGDKAAAKLLPEWLGLAERRAMVDQHLPLTPTPPRAADRPPPDLKAMKAADGEEGGC